MPITNVLRFARPAMFVPAYFLHAIFLGSLRCTYGISYSLTNSAWDSTESTDMANRTVVVDVISGKQR
tara:strand:+ start:5407 stop:5610 length:204 start_codon:yes stop_codon:yes gene_type:complete